MTLKELKEKLEILIEDGKEDYAVFVENFEDDFYEEFALVFIMRL
jgi:hypothetical protein